MMVRPMIDDDIMDEALRDAVARLAGRVITVCTALQNDIDGGSQRNFANRLARIQGLRSFIDCMEQIESARPLMPALRSTRQ